MLLKPALVYAQGLGIDRSLVAPYWIQLTLVVMKYTGKRTVDRWKGADMVNWRN